jgi:predicted GIY-YIG superfamily endonuclease
MAKQWYVYITDRSISATYDRRMFANIYEAETKDEVKKLVAEDVDWLPEVKEKVTKSMSEQLRFVTSIHEISGHWVEVFLQVRKCLSCQSPFTKIDKLKYSTGGRSDFCSEECDREYSQRMDPNSITTWNNGTVYRITHKPTGLFYIGVTTRWLMQRWWEHVKAESGSRFHQFIKEHNIAEFTFEVLEVFKPSEANPYEREAHYIKIYDAVGLGLNTLNGHLAAESDKQ